jgi:hypothetical protein
MIVVFEMSRDAGQQFIEVHMSDMAIRVSSSLKTACIKALCIMDVQTIVHIATDLIPNYDIYARTGYRESMAIPGLQVAKQVVDDVIKKERFLLFVARLVQAQDKGIMGRRYRIPGLREIIKSTYALGFVFDTTNDMFVENSRHRKTRNWGVLEPGREYTITLLRLDICGNTELVRSYPKDIVENTYEDIRNIVTKTCESRNGRVWLWEGDGGIVAFCLSGKHTSAVLSAMDIVHSLFLYNRSECRLDEPLRTRIAVHAGDIEYTDNEEKMKKFELVKEIFEIERTTKPNTVNVSIVVKVMLDEILVSQLKPVDHRKNGHFRYELTLESQ